MAVGAADAALEDAVGRYAASRRIVPPEQTTRSTPFNNDGRDLER